MPLDRRITVRITSTTRNDFGEPVEATTDLQVWATLVQDNVARNIGEGGNYGLAARTWRVRFDQRFLTAHEAGQTITVLSGDEEPDVVTGVGEPTMRGPLRRRRFLDLVT